MNGIPFGWKAGQTALKRKRAGQYNPQGQTVLCESCGRDTDNTDCLCDDCHTLDYKLEKGIL